ncbi:ATP-dependent RNA helicase DHX30 isoform X2 [Scleropages formosus]|uniref:ATP-dependent RNA helicase DHX30 isoform X2 n=1 Tax=Scleropages formosus TaxID=113540 RepID=UPI0010FA808C|nr:ATP-dependent RNA helicase DHX30 isoform X2 [Scleropages formosus]
MAMSGAALVRLRVLWHFRGGWRTQEWRSVSRYTNSVVDERLASRAGVSRSGNAGRQRDAQELLSEFPEPKNLLHKTLSQNLGLSDLSELLRYHCTEGPVKKATLTVLWPKRIEVEGFASRKVEAERLAAAAACRTLKELGVLRTDDELSQRKVEHVQEEQEQASQATVGIHRDPQHRETDPSSSASPSQEDPLSLFPKPKELLGRVIQVATSSSSIKDVVQYQTKGGKTKSCLLTLRWPEEMSFQASAWRRVEAERRAAALACMKLKEMGLLSKDNQPLTHARYHLVKVREMEGRERQAHILNIPEHLEEQVREYLAQFPLEEDVRKLQKVEEIEEQECKEKEEEVTRDAITNAPYRALSPEEAEKLSAYLQEEWRQTDLWLGAELPVDAHREHVVSTVEASRVTVVAGETGCGKTTRIPRFLLEHRVLAGDGANCNILVTQPRRISAVSVAQRVAQELGPSLRHCVGYQVRLESRPPKHSGGALLFLTVGVLLRKLQTNPTLEGVSHVVVDEVHERDVNTDLLLALLRSALRDNPHLRVVLMSATGDTQRLAHYFGDCPVLKVPGFMHPVQERYLEEVLTEMGHRPPPPYQADRVTQEEDDATPDLDLVVHVIDHIHTSGEPGALLCFLPGWQDIRAVQEKLEEKPSVRSSAHILPLHSSLSVLDQQAVFQRPSPSQRKIVLATNIAETSITINDIVHVVDVGAQKEQRYDPRTKVSCLDTVWVSRSSITQRRGRAGRCQPGHAYHLFPRRRLDTMKMFPIPEILRTPLENVVMQAKIHSPQAKVVDFLSQVLDSPDEAAVRDAVSVLQETGVLDEAEALTPLGKRIAQLSCDPQLGKVLVLASLFRCVLPLLSITACLTRDPFLNSLQNRTLVSQARAELSGHSCSDHLIFSRVVQGWRQTQRNRCSRQEFLDTYTLSGSSLRFIQGLIQQFSENLQEAALVQHASECLHQSSQINQHSQEDELVKAVLAAGLYPNIIKVKRGSVLKGRFRPNSLSYRTRRGPVILHRSTVNRSKEQLPSRWLTFFTAVQSNGSVFIRDSSSIHPLALLLLTDCDIIERVSGDRVKVSLSNHSLVQFELPLQTWELLWELRVALRAMQMRGLQGLPAEDQDSRLIALLIELLNGTEQQVGQDNLHSSRGSDRESDTDDVDKNEN